MASAENGKQGLSPFLPPAKKISPEDYILAVLSLQERLEAAFNLTQEAFKNSPLNPADVERAVKKVRKKACPLIFLFAKK